MVEMDGAAATLTAGAADEMLTVDTAGAEEYLIAETAGDWYLKAAMAGDVA